VEVTRKRVVIIGGGLAGLAAATELAPRGFLVTILEGRPRLGGRASSFTDATTGQLIDACQHVSMGCCTNFSHFCRIIGIDHLLARQPCLHFMTPDGRVSRWQADPWPAPFHMLQPFLRAHFLSWTDKARIALGLLALQRAKDNDDPPFRDWLARHHQTPRTVERFWRVVLTSALNESPDRMGLRYARKVFVDAFLTDPHGGVIEVPTVPLGRLYGQELQEWLEKHGITVRLGEAAKQLEIEDDHVSAVELRRGGKVHADWFICAVPHDRLLALLPEDLLIADDFFTRVKKLESSPITSVHLWYDRPVLDLPHVVLVGCVGQWVFNRGQIAPDEHYVQIVVSASRRFRGIKHEEVQELVAAEMSSLFPAAASAKLLRVRVVTEHAATFSAIPGVDRWRLPQETPIDNLFLAGDWTQTGWPATMEGAVRSGYLAAEAIVQNCKLPIAN
jgi:squalene-associated FAD-dependent desaturase